MPVMLAVLFLSLFFCNAVMQQGGAAAEARGEVRHCLVGTSGDTVTRIGVA